MNIHVVLEPWQIAFAVKCIALSLGHLRLRLSGLPAQSLIKTFSTLRATRVHSAAPVRGV